MKQINFKFYSSLFFLDFPEFSERITDLSGSQQII